MERANTNLPEFFQLEPFPLEAEAMARMAQYELSKLSQEELLEYSQQSVLVMSQLRHYAAQLILFIEQLGYAMEVPEDQG